MLVLCSIQSPAVACIQLILCVRIERSAACAPIEGCKQAQRLEPSSGEAHIKDWSGVRFEGCASDYEEKWPAVRQVAADASLLVMTDRQRALPYGTQQ
jgi:hypothetical protein